MIQPALDLFGEVPITTDDLYRWTAAVPGIPPGSPRADAYIKHYNVVGKVRAAKLAGNFEEIVSEGLRQRWSLWHPRLTPLGASFGPGSMALPPNPYGFRPFG